MGDVVAIEEEVLDQAIRSLYRGNPDYEPEEDAEFDSEIDLDADLPDRVLDSLEDTFAVLLNPGRFLRIPERDSAEAFACMRSFAGEIEDGCLKEALIDTLDGKRAFRRFKDVLTVNPGERKRWNAFNARQMRNVIRTWLEALGIKPARKRRPD
jgi:hypothetical protein